MNNKVNKKSQISFDKNELSKVFNKLSLVDKMKLNGYINDEVMRASEIAVTELCSRYNYIVDSAILEFFDCSFEELDMLKKVMVEYREDFDEVVSKFKNDKEYENYMSNLNNELIDRIDECIYKGMKQNDVLKAIKKEFEGVSKATIINTYKARKSEIKACESENIDTVDVVDEVCTEKLAEYIVSEEKEEFKSKFKVEYKEIVVTGETGKTYTIKDNKIDGNSKDELLNIADEVIESVKDDIDCLNIRIRELQQKIVEMELTKKEIIEVAKEFLK